MLNTNFQIILIKSSSVMSKLFHLMKSIYAAQLINQFWHLSTWNNLFSKRKVKTPAVYGLIFTVFDYGLIFT